MKKEYRFDHPLWRRKYSAESPDGKIVAEINPAYEVSMGNPTYGTLILSSGVNLGMCNPCFLWSDDSKYLAVPRYSTNWLFGIGKQKLIILDVHENRGWQSKKLAHYIQPDTFESGKLSVILNPVRSPKTVRYGIPEDLTSFSELKLPPKNTLQPVGEKE